jgi:hypothetical protein
LDVRDTKFAVTCHRACYPRCLRAFFGVDLITGVIVIAGAMYFFERG